MVFVSHPTRMRGLKCLEKPLIASLEEVASHADAWIEINYIVSKVKIISVASHADAWIEIKCPILPAIKSNSRIPRGCVD